MTGVAVTPLAHTQKRGMRKPLPNTPTVRRLLDEAKTLLERMQADNLIVVQGSGAPGYSDALIRKTFDGYRVTDIQRFLFQGRRNASKYQMTEDQYFGMLEEQGCACAICTVEFTPDLLPVIDHNHKTGVVRGLLCGTCNTALGLFKDSPDLLDVALTYLEERGCYGPNEAENT